MLPKNELLHQNILQLYGFSLFSFLFPGISSKLLLFAIFLHNNSWSGHCLRFDAFVRYTFYVNFWLKLYWTYTFTIINIMYFLAILFWFKTANLFYAIFLSLWIKFRFFLFFMCVTDWVRCVWGYIFIQQKLCIILSNRTYWLNDSNAPVPDASLIWWNWPQTKTDCFSNVAKKPKLDRLIAMLKTMPKPIWGKHYRTSYAFLCFFAHVFFLPFPIFCTLPQ